MPADPTNIPVPLAEISQGPSAFELFLDKNQKYLILLMIALVIGTAGYVVYRGIKKSAEVTAGAALSKAADLASLQSVTNEHVGTRAAGSAAVLLAERQWSEGQQDAAIQTLRDFISANAHHAALPSAQASLGAKLMAQGKSADATEIFQQILDSPDARFIQPYALISLGDMALVAGDPDKAELSYNRVQQDFPDSGFSGTAGERIASLRAKPPVEVEPAAPTAPAPDAQSAAPPVDSAPTVMPVPAPPTVTTQETPVETTEDPVSETPPSPEP